MERRRVVVTGLGAVTPVGIDVASSWEALLNGRSGVGPITHFDAAAFDVHFAAEVKGFDATKYVKPNEVRKHDPFTLFGLAGAEMALQDARLNLAAIDLTRAGVLLGSGIGGLPEIEAQHRTLMERGPGRVSPFLIPKMMLNAVAGQISIRFGLKGPNFTCASACASGSHALMTALRIIQYGDADVMVTGGTEAATTPLGLAGFCSLRALSTRNDEPERASRPFDKMRDGFVMGEGAGVLVFEELSHALRRNAPIYCEVLGAAATGDAHHITQPSPDGEGAVRAMKVALKDARLTPDQVDYVNAHGTSTHYNDITETKAIKAVFGERARKLAVSSTKSMIGHLLGAAGGVGTLVAALSVRHDLVHPTANYEVPDPECDLDYVPGEARATTVRAAIANSFGFGGHNACFVVGKFSG